MRDGDLFPRPTDPLDRLVRAELDELARVANAEGVLAVVHDRLRPRRRPRWALAPVALVAALLLSFLLFPARNTLSANPAALVAEARQADTGADRCYRVRTEVLSERPRWVPPGLAREAVLWTRGDRYRIVPGPGGQGAWGRDETDRVWIALSSGVGVRFDADEVPPRLRDFLAVRAMHLPTLLGEVLRDTDLTREPPAPDTAPGASRLTAVPRPGTRTTLLGAVLEIDPRSHAVERVVLTRQAKAGDHFRTTFTRQDGGRPPSPEQYGLEGNLAPRAVVYDRGAPLLRVAVLLRARLGALTGR